MKKRQELIELITKHLETIKYKRNNNFEQYSLQDLIKVCFIYKISI
jgi:cytidine deaminase